MQCLILAGGLGTRMKGVTGGGPKALLPVGSRAFLDWQLEWLGLLGVTEAVLALGFGADQIQRHIDGLGGAIPRIRVSLDGDRLLGTGGAIRRADSLLQERFLVTYGDSFLMIDALALMRAHERQGKGVTMSIFENSDAGDRSNVLYNDGTIRKYDKTNRDPAMRHIDYGMSAYEKRYLQAKAPQGAFDLSSFLTFACERGDVAPFLVDRPFFEVGSPSGYEGFTKLLASVKFDLRALRERI